MYEELDVDEHHSSAPPLINALTEVPRTLIDMSGLAASLPLLSTMRRGDGHPVLVLPGFLAGDESTAALRRYLNYLNYKALPWELGRNTGRPELLQVHLIERFEEVRTNHEAPVSLIGQSLGGVYARELARMFPDSVRQVITLGSPFGTRHGNSALPLVRRMFEQQSGMTVEEMRQLLEDLDPHLSPPVPMTAIYSRGDGIVNWRVCREEQEDDNTENIEVCGSHCGMGFNAQIYYIIANRLAQQVGDWQKFPGFRGAMK